MEKCAAKSKILLIRSIISDSDDYNEKYAKIRFNSNDDDGDLPLNKTVELHNNNSY